MALVTRLDTAYADGDALMGVEPPAGDGLNNLLQSAGWELIEEIDGAAGQQDRVYKSDGVDGNQILYLRLTHEVATRRIHVRTYSYWAVGTPGTGYNEIGDVAGSTCVQYPAGGFDAWAVVNKDALAVVVDYDGGTTYNKFFGGKVEPLVAAQHNFNQRLGPPVDDHNSAGDDKLRMQLGTDYTDLEDDQYLWLVSQGNTGPGNTERVQVSSYVQATETINLVDPLNNDFVYGAIVALAPQPVVLWGSSTGQLSTSTPYALYSTEAYEQAALSWSSFLDFIGTATIPATDYAEYPLAEVILYDSAVDQKNVFGLMTRFRRAPTGSAVAEDTFTAGADQSVNFPDGGGFFALQVT